MRRYLALAALCAWSLTAQQLQYVFLDVGGDDTYAVATPAGTGTACPTAYRAGHVFGLIATTANTGAATFAPCGLGALAIKKADGTSDPADGDIAAGSLYLLTWVDAATDYFRMQPVGTGTGTVNSGGTVAGCIAFYPASATTVDDVVSTVCRMAFVVATNKLTFYDSSGVATGTIDADDFAIENLTGTASLLTLTDQSSDPAAPGASKTEIYAKAGIPYYRAGAAGAATLFGDASTNTATSVDGEAVEFSGTAGKTFKRSSLTASVVKMASGVRSAATANDATGIEYCADAGSTDAYACSLSPAIASYATGACYVFKANTVNTGAATLNLNSLGAKTIKKPTATTFADLADGDIRAGQIVEACYDGTNMVMASMLGNQGGSTPHWYQYFRAAGIATASNNISRAWDTHVVEAGFTGNAPHRWAYLAFPDSASNYAIFHLTLPFTPTALTLNIKWMNRTAGNGNIRVEVATVCGGDGEAVYDPTYNTSTLATVTMTSTNNASTTWSPTPAITGCVAGEEMFVKVGRVGGDGADSFTSTHEVGLLGAMVDLTP